MGTREPSSTGKDISAKRMEYRQRAAECRDLALDTSNQDAREELMNLASIWMALADTRPAPVAP